MFHIYIYHIILYHIILYYIILYHSCDPESLWQHLSANIQCQSLARIKPLHDPPTESPWKLARASLDIVLSSPWELDKRLGMGQYPLYEHCELHFPSLGG